MGRLTVALWAHLMVVPVLYVALTLGLEQDGFLLLGALHYVAALYATSRTGALRWLSERI